MLRYLSKGNENTSPHRDLHTYIHSSITYSRNQKKKKWKQSKYPSSDEWINRVFYFHKIEYCWSIRRTNYKYVLQHNESQSIVPSERSQTESIIYSTIPFKWSFQKRQTYRDRKQMNGRLGLGAEAGADCKQAQKSFGGWWKCSKARLKW